MICDSFEIWRRPVGLSGLLPLSYLNRGLFIGASLMLSACNEPEPMVDYIAHTKSQAKIQGGHPPVPLLSLTANPALPYQAHAARNPFFWEPLSVSTNRSVETNIDLTTKSASEAELRSNERWPACELAPLPDLVLRAIFHEHPSSGAASALIQVAGAEIYPVTLGQRLVAKVNNHVVADVGEDLGKVTAITAQSLTLTPSHAVSESCHNTHTITLNLY